MKNKKLKKARREAVHIRIDTDLVLWLDRRAALSTRTRTGEAYYVLKQAQRNSIPTEDAA